MTDAAHRFNTLEHFVLHKRVRTASQVADGTSLGDPTAGGYAWNDRLRCQRFECVSGPAVGKAEFFLVANDTNLPSVERELVNYQTDDLVRVVVRPLDHPVVGNSLPDA
ncbi:MAG: hypothetical protein AAGL98_13845, partial [Planctomycetota bacterium]